MFVRVAGPGGCGLVVDRGGGAVVLPSSVIGGGAFLERSGGRFSRHTFALECPPRSKRVRIRQE